MRVRRLGPAAVLLLAPVLAACGGDGDPDGSDDPTSTPSTPESSAVVSETATESSAPPSTSTPAEPAAPGACDLVTSDDVAKALGVDFGPGEADRGDEDEGALAWRTDECSFEATDLVEVTVKVTTKDDFTQGAFTCPQPSDSDGIVEPADDTAGATKGWWKVSSAPPLEATLRACAATVNVDVDFDYEDGVDYDGDPRDQSARLAELVLSNLQG